MTEEQGVIYSSKHNTKTLQLKPYIYIYIYIFVCVCVTLDVDWAETPWYYACSTILISPLLKVKKNISPYFLMEDNQVILF